MRQMLTALLILSTASNLSVARFADPVAQSQRADVPQVVATSNQDTSWQPTVTQVNAVVSQAKRYFELQDSGRLDEAYALFSPSQKAVVPFVQWRSAVEGFNARAGAPGGRTLRKVTWYKNPAQARPGIYAAVDFSSSFSNLALHCGYVIWEEQSDGSFALTREEQTVLDRDAAAKLKPGQMDQIRAQFRC